MISSQKNGIGSFFHHVDDVNSLIDKYPSDFDPKGNKLFYTGRQAIAYIIKGIMLNKYVDNIWLPEYYCQHVTQWLKACFPNINFYAVQPLNPEHVVNIHKFAKNGDIVLINNFWGVSNCSYSKNGLDITVIDDHSHGWLSKSCIDSKADFCIASLRKTLPIPLGAIAWKPNEERIENELVFEENTSYIQFWNSAKNAMINKANYAESGIIDDLVKQNFLQAINENEHALHNNYQLVKVEETHRKIIKALMRVDYMRLKRLNMETLWKHIEKSTKYHHISQDDAFGLIIHLKDEQELNKLRNHLIAQDIYPSLLWPQNKHQYGYFLNIHIDFRYGIRDMEYIWLILESYTV